MSDLKSAPGVLGATITTYVTAADVKHLLGCADNKAYQTIRDVNKAAKEEGKMPYGKGRANKYIFAEKFGIPIDVVNAVIEEKKQ